MGSRRSTMGGEQFLHRLVDKSESHLLRTYSEELLEARKSMQVNTEKLSKSLICVEYPGVVKNVDKMIDTLGGLREISSVFSSKNRRLELRFRPGDVFCKPACGDRQATNGILCKIRVRKRKSSSENPDPKVVSLEVLGRATTSFKFRSVCDFQYLPMDQKDGKMVSVLDTVLPSSLVGNNLLEWLEEPAGYFLPPAAFSRVDSISLNSYQYRKDGKNVAAVTGPLIGRTRKRRAGHAVFVSFNVEKIPHRPREKAVKFLELKFLAGEPYEKVNKCFEERPIWSKLALMAILNLTGEALKYLLPAVSYYFITGPFRVMWVKFGYDPRKDPAARIYQTLDYRIRAPAGLLSVVKAKRGYASYLSSKSNHPPGGKNVVISKEHLSPLEDNLQTQFAQEDSYIFFPNRIPPARQMFYQYCDIKAPEIEAMLARLPRVPSNTKCDPRNGWLPPGFDNQCRDIINEYVMKLLKKDVNVEESLKGEYVDDSTDEEAPGEWEEEFDDEEVDCDSDQHDDN